jgi:putative chitinase
MGAGMAVGAAGTAAYMMRPGNNQNQYQEPEQEYNLLSNNTENETVLQKTAINYGLRGTELAQFLAQMKHESWDFSKMEEQPKSENYFNKYDIRFKPHVAKKLGNTHPGDGERFKGRGYVQLTGRENYARASKWIGQDLLSNPDLAATPAVAAKIAVEYWKHRVQPFVSNFADTAAVTKQINSAMLDLGKRHDNFKQYMNIL